MQTPEKSEIVALVAALIPAREYVITKYGEQWTDDTYPTEEAAMADVADPYGRIDGSVSSYGTALASLSLTVGASPDGSWNYQTGDNSFTGVAYGHPDWAVVTLDADSKPEEVAGDILDQIAELQCYHA